MQSDRIAELLQPFLPVPLAKSQLQDISTYIDMLLRWNARINLTAVRQPEEIVTRHFGESLFAARHLFPQPEHPNAPAGQSIPRPPQPSAANLVAPRGRLALLIVRRQMDSLAKLVPTFQWSEPVPIPLSEERILLIGHHPNPPYQNMGESRS